VPLKIILVFARLFAGSSYHLGYTGTSLDGRKLLKPRTSRISMDRDSPSHGGVSGSSRWRLPTSVPNAASRAAFSIGLRAQLQRGEPGQRRARRNGIHSTTLVSGWDRAR
jgi:hypothetical protein